MHSTLPSTIGVTQKIAPFFADPFSLHRPYYQNYRTSVNTGQFVHSFLSEIQSSQEIQSACTNIEASLTGTYLANQIIDLHPVYNDKDIKVLFFARPGQNKDELYRKVHAIAKKHLMRHVVPAQFLPNFQCDLRDIGVLRDSYAPCVKGMGIGSISLSSGWGFAPLELTVMILDESSLTHLTNVDSLYVPLNAFGPYLGSEVANEFTLCTRENAPLETVLSDLENRIITSSKTDWDPAQVSHYELARYFIWIVERWTEPGISIFPCFAKGCLSKVLSVQRLWQLVYEKVYEKRSMFSSYPFFLLSNFLFHFSDSRDPSLFFSLKEDFATALESLKIPARSLHNSLQKLLYTEEIDSGNTILKLKPDAFSLFFSHIPFLAKKVDCRDHLGRKVLRCLFEAHGEFFSILVPTPLKTEPEHFRRWIFDIVSHKERPKYLHLLYLMENEILDWIGRSFCESNERGLSDLLRIFTVLSPKKRLEWASLLVSRFPGTDLSCLVPQCLDCLNPLDKMAFVKELALKNEEMFFRALPYIQSNLSLTRQELLTDLIGSIDSPSFYQRYIGTCEENTERESLLHYVASCKRLKKDIPILQSIFSLYVDKKDKAIFLGGFLSEIEVPLWENYLAVLDTETECLDLMEELFFIIDEEPFWEGMLQVGKNLPIQRQIAFEHAVISRIAPYLSKCSESFQEKCREKIGSSLLIWVSQMFSTHSQAAFFKALTWALAPLTPEKKAIFINNLILPLVPDLDNISESFWESMEPILLPLVTKNKMWKSLCRKLILELSTFPSCLNALVHKCELTNIENHDPSVPISTQNWIFNLKLALLQQNAFYIKRDLNKPISQDKLQEIQKHFASAKVLKPIFDELLQCGYWKEADVFLRGLKSVFGAQELLTWYVDFAQKNSSVRDRLEKACLRDVQSSWTLDNSWDYFASTSSFPLVASWLLNQGFSNPSGLPSEKKTEYLSRIYTVLPGLIDEGMVSQALSLAVHLPSLGAGEPNVSGLLIKLFEKCRGKEDRVVVANLIQKLAPTLTFKLVQGFQRPYAQALSNDLPISSSFSIDLWMIAFLEACLAEEAPHKLKAIFSWITGDVEKFFRKFPHDFSLIAGKYVEKMSGEEKDAFISSVKDASPDAETLHSRLQSMGLTV